MKWENGVDEDSGKPAQPMERKLHEERLRADY
jgi:hypothetical protein